MKSTGILFFMMIALVTNARADNFIDIQNLPPVVIQTSPIAGSTDISAGTSEIRVIFSKEMQDKSWSWIKMSDNSFPELVGEPHFLSDKKTCVLGIKLQPGHSYAVWLNSTSHGGFKDNTGHNAVPYLLTFSTKP